MRKRWLLTSLPVAGVFTWALVRSDPAPSVRFLDVGQGDAAIVSSGNTQILIDGGPDNAVLNGLGGAFPVFDRTIELVVLTHPHTDHYRGLSEVFERYQVGALIVGVPGAESEYRALIDLARARNIPVIPASGQSVTLPAGITFTIIHPVASFPDEPTEHPNDRSVVARLRAGPTDILFIGDAETSEERELLTRNADLDADILKVGHHGSKTSSTPGFLRAVSPEAAIISLGADNRFGHPATVTLDSLHAVGARSFRTDQQGTITVTLHADGYRIVPER